MIAIDRAEIFKAIEIERERQNRLHPLTKLKNADAEMEAMHQYIMTNEFMNVLVEELGEIAHAILCRPERDCRERQTPTIEAVGLS